MNTVRELNAEELDMVSGAGVVSSTTSVIGSTLNNILNSAEGIITPAGQGPLEGPIGDALDGIEVVITNVL
jgi:hypothetical protein